MYYGSVSSPSPLHPPTDFCLIAFPELCGRCQQPLARAQPAVRALSQLFHITCFTCHQCGLQLQGQQFYSLEGAPYCESCYTVSLGYPTVRVATS